MRFNSRRPAQNAPDALFMPVVHITSRHLQLPPVCSLIPTIAFVSLSLMERSGELKRRAEDADELESPEVKRLRIDLFDILDDDASAATGDYDLASVMKSLEEEIALPSPPVELQLLPQESLDVAGQPDLGFLYEASDDELGLPPTDMLSSVGEGAGSAEAAEIDAVVDPEVAGFGQLWGFDDAVNGYEGFGLGLRPGGAEAEDVGLFDYAVEASGPYDLSDLSWRPESLPAV